MVDFFDGNGYDLGGHCLDLVLGGILIVFEIDAMQLNDSSPVSDSSGERT